MSPDGADATLVGFRSDLRVRLIPAEAVYLVSENGVTALSGAVIERLAPLLDGTRTVAGVMKDAPEVSATQVTSTLSRLSQARLLSLVRPAVKREFDERSRAYWDLAGVGPDSVAALPGSTVAIHTAGSADPEASATLARACRDGGLHLAAPGIAALTVVICDDYLDPELDAVNADHLASGRPWLLARPSGSSLWIGPVFQPGSGPCWGCLATRLAGNRPGELLIRRLLAGDRLPAPSLPAVRAAAAHLIALETVKWLGGLRYEGQREICVVDTVALHSEHHRVHRRPQCRACGDPRLVSDRMGRPVSTVVRAIADGGGNGHRTRSPADVLAEYGHLIDPLTGVVGELRRPEHCPDFVHAYVSGRNRALRQTSADALRSGLRSHCGGKGATDLEARVGALAEAVERYCGTLQGDELTVRDSYRGLGDQAVHPDTCQLFDQRQYADRHRWNAICAHYHQVPEPFDEHAVTDWTPTWSLLSGERRLLPTALLYFRPDATGLPSSVRADSNGNAAGASVEDAIAQGFLELVERDAVALWWYNRTRQAEVCLDSFDDPWVSRVPELYRRLGRQIWVLDLTSDLGVPAMAAVSRRTGGPGADEIMLGFGAHFDPAIALRRALTELGQMLPALGSFTADGREYLQLEENLSWWWENATVASQPYLAPDASQPRRTAASYRYRPSERLDLAEVRSVADRARLDVLVLDQTRPDLGMPVVKVVIPGLRHFWPRFAPGRLFDVPVRLGRLPAPTRYEMLNPIPVFM